LLFFFAVPLPFVVNKDYQSRRRNTTAGMQRNFASTALRLAWSTCWL